MAEGDKTYTQAEIDALTQKLHNAVGEAEDLKRQMKGLKAIDPEDYKKLKYELDGYKQKAAEGDPEQIAKLLKDKETEIRGTIQQQIDELTENNKSLSHRLKEREVVDSVFNIAATKFVDHAYDDVKDYIRKYCDTDKDGTILVKDEKGQPRYKKGSTAVKAGPEDFVEWLVEAKPHWAKAPGGTGSRDAGNKSSSGSADVTSITWKELEGMTQEQISKIPRDVLATLKV